MPRRRTTYLPTWSLFAIPAVIAVAIIAGILAGGPALGFLAAVAAAVAILVVAIRMEPGRKRQAPAHDDARRRRAAARRFLVPIAIVVAGTVVILVGDGTVRIIGWGVLAVGVTIAMSLVFLEIGYSEERAYARGEEGRVNPPGARRL